MAKYLWVGYDTTGISFSMQSIDDAVHIDQYCWNRPGNWYLYTLVGGVPSWVPTWELPKPFDSVVVGDDGLSSTTQGSIQGWTHAKSPLLWGGYSGGVRSGSWSTTGLPGDSYSGFTFTSAIANFSFNETIPVPTNPRRLAYEFPYVGGGLTGEVLNWVAARDRLPPHVYTKEYSNTGRDPLNGLVLKVGTAVNIKTYKDPSNYRPQITIPTQINSNNRMIIDLNFVKAITALTGGSSSIGTVQTNLTYNKHDTFIVGSCGSEGVSGWQLSYPRMPGLRINNGSFYHINLQPHSSEFYSSLLPSPENYNLIGDYGVVLKNVTAMNVSCSKKQRMYFDGCTFGSMNITQFGFGGNVNSNSSSGFRTGLTYTDEIPITIASNFDRSYVDLDIVGITSATASTGGVLTLMNTPVRFHGIHPNYLTPYTPSQVATFPQLRSSVANQRVIIGDLFGSRTIKIPQILVSEPTGWWNYMPWGIEVAGTVITNTIVNEGGYIYSHADITTDRSFTCQELQLTKASVLDFSKNEQNFDDWRFGGFSGGSISGGIVFGDELSKVEGSVGVRLWNTQTIGKRYDQRTGTPLTSAPSLLGFETMD